MEQGLIGVSEKVTTVGKYHNVPDDELRFVYAHSDESGGMFGLEVHGTSLFGMALAGMGNDPEQWLAIEHAPHSARYIAQNNLSGEPRIIDYTLSGGDGSSHGATWPHFAEALEPLSIRNFHRLGAEDLRLQLDGLLNMASEGARRDGGGWTVIAEGLRNAQNELLEGSAWTHRDQRTMYEGLGYIATNFVERDQAKEKAFAAAL